MQTIRDLLVGVQAANRATLPHSNLPLSEIKRVAGIRSGQSIYDVLFIYQESLLGKHQRTATVKQVAHQDYLETKLLVEVEPRVEAFECRFTYHTGAFPEAQISAMFESIRALVSYMLENIDSELRSLRSTFPQHLLSVFNPTPTTFAGIPDLAYAVERVAAETAEKDAVCFADRMSDGVHTTTTISFAELNRTADQIAWHLSEGGVRHGEVVAIVMEKSIRLYAGILAILKVGCAYLPLLPSTPVARIETILEQSKVGICLVDTSTRDALEKQLRCNFIDVQALDLGSTPAPKAKPAPDPDPDRLAYIIYTSGSTGVPKGVCVTQLNIMSNLDVLSRIYPVTEGSRLLQSCSQAFDVSVFEIFFAWTRGMCLCSGTNDTLFEDLERAIRTLGITHLSMTPTVASLIEPAKVPRVEFLVTAGEAMTEVVAQKWGDKLYQGYGPSETTNICSVKRMGLNQPIQHLGWSFENTSTVVLARDGMEVVPFGCLGEFCFGGDQVAQGYLNMEELTAAKFISHPTFGRIYRSGDLGRMLPDGSMVIVGRADEQIKIRGQRVELNEITEAHRESSIVADCTTMLLRAEEGTATQDKIISYVVPKQHQAGHFEALDIDSQLQLKIQSIYHSLEARLSSYMVPSAIVPVSLLPTTASGKLDRTRLKQVFKGLDQQYVVRVSHGTELNEDGGEWSDAEIQVAAAVSEALGMSRPNVQRWTPLATLGLDSISAIHLSRQLHKSFGRRLPISVILKNPSVARLAKVLSNTTISASGKAETLGLLSTDIVEKATQRLSQAGKSFSKILPCTPLQEAMLATSTGKGQYLNRMLLRVTGDVTRLRGSWNAMCARHDILRTCFLTTDDPQFPIVQVPLDQWEAHWYDFEASQTSIKDCVSRHAEAVPAAIDSLQPAVSFATITQQGTGFVSFVCHHALYDGVAIERLLYEVEQHFSGSPLPPAPAYDQFLRESLALPESSDSFWLEHLADFEPKLATNLKSQLPQMELCQLNSEIEIPLSHISTRAQQLGVSVLALTQSAWAVTLSKVLQTTDICFGNVFNGRSLPVEGISAEH
ncbi:hypothetical protein NEMBOFW57_007974 [Staphylotrichum longicolle]|uniref:Carrier domain-containing protein n=1 Tax=Staphylotrichum longicolle TaxID=669026 RepID=A0AAD4EQU2_9PEZI|nr:hypothetical protein NEMBOFW57_007974 [Staphylotrichum longicolle]